MVKLLIIEFLIPKGFRTFRNRTNYEDKHKKMAEELIHTKVDISEIDDIVVYNEGVKKGVLKVFEQNGWTETADGRWRFTPGGFLLSNVLIGILLESQTKEKFNANPWIREAFEALGKKVPLPVAQEPYMN